MTTKRGGLGHALAICRSILTAHGGHIWATNNPERGVTFVVSLPLAADQRAPESDGRVSPTIQDRGGRAADCHLPPLPSLFGKADV